MKKVIPIYLFIFCWLLYAYSNAATITVTTNADSGPGSLRDAVAIAKPGDVINFNASLNNKTIFLTSGQIDINKNLTINGLGSSHLTINGTFKFRIFSITSGANVKITNLKLFKGVDAEIFSVEGKGGGVVNLGNAVFEKVLFDSCFTFGSPNRGGAIYNDGNLDLYDCTFRQNQNAAASTELCQGGALYNSGKCIISSSTFTLNQNGGIATGGAIYNTDDLIITKSTFNGNASVGVISAFGGAIYNDTTGNAEIINSTISGNSANGDMGEAHGGGIYNIGKLKLIYSTVTANSAIAQFPFGGGFYNNIGNLTLNASLIAGNELGTGAGTEDGSNFGTIVDLGYNLIGIYNANLGLTSPTNIKGSIASPVDPKLGPLQNNGGLTYTHALLVGSPAIDKADPDGPYPVKDDQRGVARPYNSIRDIGSFEYTGAFPSIIITSPVSGDVFTAPATINILTSSTNTGEGAYLNVTNPSGGYRKLKIGYDSASIYKGSHNVTLTGNNKLEIVLNDFTGTADWTKIQIRPNGSTINPLVLAPYITAAGGVVNHFATITIPLSNFDPSIDFTHLTMFELPYSTNAPAFNIGIQKIIFTGGTKPFLWFGDDKINNAHDGNGSGGQLVASLVPATAFAGIHKVEFYNGSVKIGEDYTPPFTFTWNNVQPGKYTLTALLKCNNGTIDHSQDVNISVAASASLFSNLKQGTNATIIDISVYPNPVRDKLYIDNFPDDMKVSIFDEMGNKVFENQYYNKSDFETDLSFLPNGIYILKMQSDVNQINKVVKLVKE